MLFYAAVIGLAQMALGGLTNGITTLEMAAAYAAFPRGGLYIEPRTYTRVEQLDRPRRREELARLSGGASTAILLEGAEELLQKAEAWKQTQA